MSNMSQVEYIVMELRENSRMKRRQAEILCAEADTLVVCADRIERAIEVDKKRSEQGAKETKVGDTQVSKSGP